MKTNFGNTFTRLLHGGVVLTSIEKQILGEFVKALPLPLRLPVEEELQSYNLAQRECDGRAINFYRKKFFRPATAAFPLLPVKSGEIKLLSLSFTILGQPRVFHATITAVNRRLFCMNFSEDLRPFASNQLVVKEITESWRSGIKVQAK
jgi:hypothetical protein